MFDFSKMCLWPSKLLRGFVQVLIFGLISSQCSLLAQNLDTITIPEAAIFYQLNQGSAIHKMQLDSQFFVDATLGDLLQKNTGVFINSNGVSGLQSISIRGTGSARTRVYWNGLSIQSPTLGIVDLSTVSSATLDHVEIHTGAAALVDGAGGLGGSVQLSDQLEYDSLLQTSLQTGFGSFGKSYRNFRFAWANKQWSTLINFADVAAPNVFAFVNPTTVNLRIDTLKNAGLKSLSSKVGIGWRTNEKIKIEALVWFNNTTRELPKSITAHDFGDDFQEDLAWRTVLTFNYTDKRMLHQVSIGRVEDRLDYYADFLSKIKTLSSQGNYRQTFYANSFLKVKSALEFSHQMAQSDGFVQRKDQYKIAAMVNPQFKWKQILTADLIVRLDSYDGIVVPWMPALLLNYHLNKRLNLRATASRIYRQPTFNDLYWFPQGNPNLLPEHGSSFELGLDILPQNQVFNASVTAFRSAINNWIIWYPVNGIHIPQNLYLVNNKGIEVGINMDKKINHKLQLKSNIQYAFVDASNEQSSSSNDNSLGKQLVFVPQHRVNASLGLLINNRWAIAYRYQFNDKRYIAPDHSSWMPYYMLSDVSAQCSFPNMRWVDYVSVSVNNLFNKNYQVVPHQPMMQRNVMVNFKFNYSRKYGA